MSENYIIKFKRRGRGAAKMAQWLKTLTTKPEDLSLSPGTHFYMCHGTCAHTHTHTGAGREAEIKGFNAQKITFKKFAFCVYRSHS